MGKIIAVVNQKGGVGKTTTTVNLAAALTDLGLKTLVCDFDPQANATSGLGLDKRKIKKTIYDVVINGEPVEKAIVSTKFAHVLPSSADLAGAGVELISMPDPNHRLGAALNQVKDKYDVIFIDCPPSLEMLTLNGLAAADGILVPVQCEYYALEGLSDLMATLRMVKRRINPRLEIFAVALTIVASYMQLAAINLENAKLRQEITKLESEENALNAKKEQLYNLAFVESYARDELGMVKMDKSQVHYLEMDSGDRMVLAEAAMTNHSGSDLLERLSQAFSTVLEYLN